MRLQAFRELGIRLPASMRIPATRVAALARSADAAKASAILRVNGMNASVEAPGIRWGPPWWATSPSLGSNRPLPTTGRSAGVACM